MTLIVLSIILVKYLSFIPCKEFYVMELIDKVIYGKYLSYYGQLLTDKQREVLKFYLDMDMSLFEISKELNVSRQAVRDIIVRSTALMNEYEKKLALVKKNEELQKKILEIINECDNKKTVSALKNLYDYTEVN